MPAPVPVTVWVMEYPAQFRVMSFAPTVMPVLVEQTMFPVSVVLLVMVLPQAIALTDEILNPAIAPTYSPNAL